jgi:hypothetical protein
MKNKGGRPAIVLSPEQVAQVEAMAGFLTLEQIADFFGIGHRTMAEVKDRQPEVLAAYKKGRSRAFGAVGKGILQRAIEGDNTAAIFYAKTQMRWRETSILEVETSQERKTLADFFPKKDAALD